MDERSTPQDSTPGCMAHAFAHDPACPGCCFRAGQEEHQRRALTTIETFIATWTHTEQPGADRVRQVLDDLHHLLSVQPWESLHEQAERLMSEREQSGETQMSSAVPIKPQDRYAHFGCDKCGAVFMLPWDDEDAGLPWCTHGGASQYQWPVHPSRDWDATKARWIEIGRTEMQFVQVSLPAPSRRVLDPQTG